MGSAEQRRGRPAGRGWGEVSGDRILALCEYGNGTWWPLDDDDPAVQRQNTHVEIAKAARVFLDEHQRQKGSVLGEFDFLVYEEMETRLRSALARLDSGATEGARE